MTGRLASMMMLACLALAAGRVAGLAASDLLELVMRWKRRRLVRQILRRTSDAAALCGVMAEGN